MLAALLCCTHTVQRAQTRLSGEVRRLPRRLERMLAQAKASDTPKRSRKRQIHLTAEEESSNKKRREDLIDSVVEVSPWIIPCLNSLMISLRSSQMYLLLSNTATLCQEP